MRSPLALDQPKTMAIGQTTFLEPLKCRDKEFITLHAAKPAHDSGRIGMSDKRRDVLSLPVPQNKPFRINPERSVRRFLSH